MGKMLLKIWDVEHGACATVCHHDGASAGRMAMIDCGTNSSTGWRPSQQLRLWGRSHLDYLLITNADQDHLSGLAAFENDHVGISVLHRNPGVTADELRVIKEKSGPLTADAERFVSMHGSYNGSVAYPFDDSMGGITIKTYNNSYPAFKDTNNLSMVYFLRFGGFTALFPGDMEKDGWRALLAQPGFKDDLSKVDILVASHHGRENGFCPEVFNYCIPSAVVISDKPIVHATQETVPDYRRVVRDEGVYVATTMKTRHVLTTRRDGTIAITVSDDGRYVINTEKRG